MANLQLVALKAFPYRGGSIAVGDVFEAQSAFDAHALTTAHLASDRQPVIVDPAADIEVDQTSISHHVGTVDEVLEIPAKRYRRARRPSDDA